MDDEDDFTAESSPRTKTGAVVLVVALHVVAIFAIIRAFAPDFTNQVAETVLRTITVTVTTPPPTPEPTKAPEPAGASGEQGKKAVPREVKAVKPKVDVAKRNEPAPKATSSGSADTSGATNSGSGTGAGGPGSGTGSGAGQGGGGSALVKTAGDINATRDFPKRTRTLRAGHAVTVEMTVGADGRANACRVVKPSPDPEADRIVCELAEKRFRFRPKTDAAGNPVSARFRWQQRWWNPRDGSGED